MYKVAYGLLVQHFGLTCRTASLVYGWWWFVVKKYITFR